MKKIAIILFTLAMFNVSTLANNIESVFTFQGYVPTSEDVVKKIGQNALMNESDVSYPLFEGDENIVKEINKTIENFVTKYKGTRNKKYDVEYTITASNNLYISILFDVVEYNKKDNSIAKYNEAISFNVKSGKELQLKDIFVVGYQDALNGVINDRIKQFGLEEVMNKKKKFTGVQKNQKFYLDDESLVLIYNKGEATEFADGNLFIPFVLRDLIGILK